MPENPFTPTFGEVPTHIAGRRSIIDLTAKAFESERRRPELTTVISGARGTGKTTLLTLLADEAAQSGWITASVTAMPGMLEDILIRTTKGAQHLLEDKSGAHITSIGIPQILDISLDSPEKSAGNWRSQMEDFLDALESQGSGLLITVDEVDVSLDEMVQLAAIYQHFVRENRKVALLMAGLPSHISALINDKTVSFLRRAEMVHLGRIEDYEIQDALRKTIEDGGRSVANADLEEAVDAIEGFPFMMQLIGFRAWDEHPDEKTISAEDFKKAIAIAREEMRSRIFDSTIRELSDADIAFLKAMAEDEVDSRIADIIERLGWSSSQVSQYKKRLLDAGVIGERRRGVIGFDMPYFRELLLD